MTDMTDQEITRLIAEHEQVMGWTRQGSINDNPLWGGDAHGVIFAPLEYDTDCMAAWDKFVMEHGTHGGMLGACLRKGKKLWIATTRTGRPSVNADRRRAMCECMAKAVSE